MTEASQQQTVIYRHQAADGPRWQFYSMPTSIVGGSDDLTEARHQYRQALEFSADSSAPEDIPTSRELSEYEIIPGFWVRLDDAGDRAGWREFLTNNLSAQSGSELDWLRGHVAASGDVILVPVELRDPLSSLLTQLTSFDSVWAVAKAKDPDSDHLLLLWLALAGESSASPDNGQPLDLAAVGLTPDSQMRDVFEAMMKHQRSFALATVG